MITEKDTMITEKDILTAINQLLVEKYPGAAVYINLCPENFIRPGFYIEHVSTSSRDKSCKTIEQTVYYTITCFIETDSHYNVDAENLMERQTEVLNLFRKGYVTVGGRAVKVKASNSGFNNGEAYVELQFEYCDDRSDSTDDTELMRTISTKVK
jgi:hypothetical protein